MPAQTQVPNALSNALQGTTQSLGKAFQAALPMIAIFMVAVAIAVVLLLYAKRRKEELAFVYLRVYDPRNRSWRDVRAREVVPGIYVAERGDVIAMVPVNASPDIVVDGRGRMVRRVYTVVSMGDFYGYYDTVKGMSLVTEKMSGESYMDPVDLIMTLYENKLVRSDVAIRPDVKVAIYLDGQKASETATELYDVTARQGLMGISSMTGQMLEVEKLINMLLELQEAKATANIMKYGGIAVLIMGAGLAVALISAFLHAGG